MSVSGRYKHNLQRWWNKLEIIWHVRFIISIARQLKNIQRKKCGSVQCHGIGINIRFKVETHVYVVLYNGTKPGVYWLTVNTYFWISMSIVALLLVYYIIYELRITADGVGLIYSIMVCFMLVFTLVIYVIYQW